MTKENETFNVGDTVKFEGVVTRFDGNNPQVPRIELKKTTKYGSIDWAVPASSLELVKRAPREFKVGDTLYYKDDTSFKYEIIAISGDKAWLKNIRARTDFVETSLSGYVHAE